MKKYLVTYEFYEGCTEDLIVMAKSRESASAKAIKQLDKIMTTDDWDIQSIREM